MAAGVLDLEARGLDVPEHRRPVPVASEAERLGHRRRHVRNVAVDDDVGEGEPATRPENATHLRQCLRVVGRQTEHALGQYDVDGAVCDRQVGHIAGHGAVGPRRLIEADRRRAALAGGGERLAGPTPDVEQPGVGVHAGPVEQPLGRLNAAGV